MSKDSEAFGRVLRTSIYLFSTETFTKKTSTPARGLDWVTRGQLGRSIVSFSPGYLSQAFSRASTTVVLASIRISFKNCLCRDPRRSVSTFSALVAAPICRLSLYGRADPPGDQINYVPTLLFSISKQGDASYPHGPGGSLEAKTKSKNEQEWAAPCGENRPHPTTLRRPPLGTSPLSTLAVSGVLLLRPPCSFFPFPFLFLVI